MHDSLHPKIKFYIDSATLNGNTFNFTGWILHEDQAISSISLVWEENHYSCNQFIERVDVKNFYPHIHTPFVGFNFTFEASLESIGFDNKFKLIADVNNESVHVADINKPIDTPEIGIINNIYPSIIAVDNFYKHPDEVRNYALSLDFQHNKEYHKGQRTKHRTFFDGTYEFFEDILKKKITSWENQPHNGVFQFCTAEDQLVYHTDSQKYAAVVFLTPNAPPECGTSFFTHKKNGLKNFPTDEDCRKLNKSKEELYWDMFQGNFYDKTSWELVDKIGNVYNRMAIWDAKLVHAATQYFGNTKENSRLFHMFFFDAE